MALEATHIRFALDLKEEYKVTNVQEYVFGTTYPDTRMLTKIPRESTHPRDFLDWDIEALSDFKKGWAAHLLCDRSQGVLFKREFPDLFLGSQTIEHGSELWIAITAVKALQDIEDLKQVDLSSFWQDMSLVQNPNNEDIDQLHLFYTRNREFYANLHNITLKDYYHKLVISGVDEHIADSVLRKAEEYQLDPKVMAIVKTLYSQMYGLAMIGLRMFSPPI